MWRWVQTRKAGSLTKCLQDPGGSMWVTGLCEHRAPEAPKSLISAVCTGTALRAALPRLG